MKITILLVFLMTQAFASEVALLQVNRNTKEIQFSFTEDALYQATEKYFLPHNCKIRTNQVVIRESFLPAICQAELMKIILSNGYKPIDAWTYYK